MEFYQDRMVQHNGKAIYPNTTECRLKKIPCLDVAEVTNFLYSGQERTIEGSFRIITV